MFAVKHPHKYVRQINRVQQVNKSRKVKTFVIALLEAWKDFCTTSSFVGFRYVYGKNRTIFDFLFWMILMVVLMTWATLFVTDFLDRYHSLSTTTIVRSQHVPISRPPFPAVTACVSGRISKSRVNNFIENYILNNEDLRQSINLTNFVRIFNLVETSDIGLKDASSVFAEYNLTMRDMLNMTTENCEEVFTVCRWSGKILPCAKIFKKTMAVGGFCCSFNYPVSQEKIVQRKLLRTKTFGINNGLSFAFKTIPNEDYYYKITYSHSLRVVIHEPYSFPVFNENDIIVPTSMETVLKIHSVYNTADNKVRNLPIGDRDCVFAFEKRLKYFNRYSNNNCMIECRMDRGIKYCGCIPYYFPSDENQICKLEKNSCSIKNRYIRVIRSDKNFIALNDCDCPDDCAVMKLNLRIQSWELLSESNYTVDEFYQKLTEDHGVVHITFGKSTITGFNRKLSFDEIQLASNIGGIISLFLGCSFVSVIEIIYFMVVRMQKLYHLEN